MNATITLYAIVLVTGDVWNVLNIHLIFLISFALLNKFTIKIAPLFKSLCCIHRHTCFVRPKFLLLLMNIELFHCQMLTVTAKEKKIVEDISSAWESHCEGWPGSRICGAGEMLNKKEYKSLLVSKNGWECCYHLIWSSKRFGNLEIFNRLRWRSETMYSSLLKM